MARDGSLPKMEDKLFKGGVRSGLGPRVQAGRLLWAFLIEHVLEETLRRGRSHLWGIPEMRGCYNASHGHILGLMHLCPVPGDEQLGRGQHTRKTKIYIDLETDTGPSSKPHPPQLIHPQGFIWTECEPKDPCQDLILPRVEI